jgi:putative pyoverdin transport system ATP-binding/permease protein
MKLIAFLLKVSRRAVILSVLIGIVAGASSAGLIAVINATYSQGTSRILVLSFAGLGVIMLVSNLISRLLLIHLSQSAIYDMRMRLSRRILAAPLDHLEKLSAPRLLATLTDDIVMITNALLGVPHFFINISIIILCLIYLGWLSMTVLLAFFVVMIVGIASYQALVHRAIHHLRRAREEQTALFRHYRALTEGIKELKIHRLRREAFLSEVLQTTAETMRKDNVKGLTFYASAESWGQFLFFLFIGLLIFILPTLRNVSPATLAAYTLTMLYITGPIQVILALLPVMGRAQVALQQVESLGLSLEASINEKGPDLRRIPSASSHLLESAGVTHTYRVEHDDNDFILGPIDLVFRPGEMVFLVGGNGSGKTTLAKIITGLYLPASGSMRLDGETITAETSEYYRQHFSAVFSDFFLFESLLGVEQRELDAQAQAYLVRLHLEHKVSVKDGVLSATALSHGQRKRLALLTAYLEDRPFYLFDEWASDQDPIFKETFYTQLLPELKSRGKTLIVITHDDKYFHLADRLIKLDYGKVIYDSTQQELAAEYSGLAVVPATHSGQLV